MGLYFCPDDYPKLTVANELLPCWSGCLQLTARNAFAAGVLFCIKISPAALERAFGINQKGKMYMKKRLLSIMLAVMVIFAMAPSAFAAEIPSTESGTAETIALEADVVSDGIYSVPVNAVKSSDPTETSMMAQALAGNALVTVSGDTAIYTLNFQPITVGTVTAGLTSISHFATSDTSETPTEAVDVIYEEDGTTVKTASLVRSANNESQIYVQMTTAGMPAAQTAILVFDWENAELVASENTLSVTAITESSYGTENEKTFDLTRQFDGKIKLTSTDAGMTLSLLYKPSSIDMVKIAIDDVEGTKTAYGKYGVAYEFSIPISDIEQPHKLSFTYDIGSTVMTHSVYLKDFVTSAWNGYDWAEPEETIALSSTSIGGVTYFYADTTNDDDNAVYQATVRSRAGSADYYFTKATMTKVADSNYYYATAPNVTALSGTLYGYGDGTVTTYKEIYNALGVETDSSFDVVSSATNYTSSHAKDIPSLTVFGTDAEGNKAITGIQLGRTTKSVDAKTYVEASILNAAGVELTEEQEAALDIVLKANPMTAPSETTIAAKFGSAEYVASKYGTGEINIYPDDTVEGYVWNEYMDSIYAATISDGTNTAGSVYWVDLYGEKSTSGYHYNKVEFELNNGISNASNLQEVNRFAAFLDPNTGCLKPGTYTVSVYAEGYDVVTGDITITESETEAQLASIGGVNYFYANAKDVAANSVIKGTVASKRGSTDYYFLKDTMTNIEGTDYYYAPASASAALSGTLYGYGDGTVATYKEIYNALGVETDSSFDVVSSATNYTSSHAKDIPSLTVFGTDAEGNKAITGIQLGRTTKSVDAKTYVEASILNAAGVELTEEQEAALDIVLKANPMTAPSETTIAAKFGSAEYVASKYGTGEINIYPDDTVEGYVWNEYMDSIYAATISDGTNTAGSVYWIDLYGEKATSGYHYNKIEFELNNGISNATNLQEVSRFAAFLDPNTGCLKPGTYTVSVYAEGYDVVTGDITITESETNAELVSIGGVNYFYANAKDVAANSVIKGTVASKRGSTDYYFLKDTMTNIEGTDYYYAPASSSSALSGTLYGYGEGTFGTYKEIYNALGVETDSSFDVVSSATNYTSHHAGDIPSLTVFGTDAEGNKAITGIQLERTAKSVDAKTYVEASILNAAGIELTEEQEAAIDIVLKANPMTAPSETMVAAKFGSAEYTLSKYGTGEINIYPDDTVEGYVWNEYMDSIYAATISDGTNTAGSVYWIDLYGEKATSGYHYNKVEFELNNGKSKADNDQDVSRFAAFFDASGKLKAGTYTVSVYAEGYDAVRGSLTIGLELADKTAAYTGSEIAIDEAQLTGVTGTVTYTYYSDAACTTALDGVPVNGGTYYVKASVGALESNVATLTITKDSASVTTAPAANKLTFNNKEQALVTAGTATGGTIQYSLNNKTFGTAIPTAKAAGTYTVYYKAVGDANHNDSAVQSVKVTIAKAANTLTAKAKSKTVSAKSKKKTTIKANKAFKVTKAQGKVTYKKASGNKKITVASNGKITVKKGLKKGTYPVKVKVTAAGNLNYNKATKTVTIKVKVK